MKRLKRLAGIGFLLVVGSCETTQSQRGRDPATGAVPKSALPDAVIAPEATGPTVYGEPRLRSRQVRCPDSSVGTKDRSTPTVDVGVSADIDDNRLKNPKVYSGVDCVP